MVIMVVAVMAILMAAAVQLASFEMQREREAELIFRGQQYVEGIRLYRQKYGRYPMRMKELWEADPKVLRRKWKDPITDSEEWGIVFLGQEGQELGGATGRGPRPSPTRTPVFTTRGPGSGEKVGPIIGVHSLSGRTAIKVYEGRTKYNEWKFVFKEGDDAGTGPGGGGGSGGSEEPTDPDQQWPPFGYPTPPPPGRTGTPDY
ncbi:MAG: hypothetical protein MUE90_13440 [Thermoanaerobaculales bacterium]|jgi:type II secretory pathway pseudopilin PulG|nr:hypothetical protein [Thermoanaerobaculales bacterium]